MHAALCCLPACPCSLPSAACLPACLPACPMHAALHRLPATRYVPRPVEGDIIYTDFYGRYGSEKANYYGKPTPNHKPRPARHTASSKHPKVPLPLRP